MDPKILETLKGMGSIGAILHGFGTHPNHSLSLKTETPILLWCASLQAKTMCTVMVPHRQVQIYLLFSTDNYYFFSFSQDHVPLCHMILALFPDYSDCIVVSAALYSSYVFLLVSHFVPPCTSFSLCCTYSLFTVSHKLGLAVYKSVGLRDSFPKLLAWLHSILSVALSLLLSDLPLSLRASSKTPLGSQGSYFCGRVACWPWSHLILLHPWLSKIILSYLL